MSEKKSSEPRCFHEKTRSITFMLAIHGDERINTELREGELHGMLLAIERYFEANGYDIAVKSQAFGDGEFPIIASAVEVAQKLRNARLDANDVKVAS